MAELLSNPFVRAAVGGVLIGLSASLLLFFSGRVLGVSGILAGVPGAEPGDRAWRIALMAGLVVGGAVFSMLTPAAFPESSRSTGTLVVAGLLVGVGTRLSKGCTSGHGVCGISRLSRRSIAAVLTFMLTGALTVFVVEHLLGGPQ